MKISAKHPGEWRESTLCGRGWPGDSCRVQPQPHPFMQGRDREPVVSLLAGQAHTENSREGRPLLSCTHGAFDT